MRPRLLLALAVATSAAPPAFQPVQPDLLSIGGAFTNAWADYDGDGDLDLFVGFGGATPNRLYRNDNGVLVDVAQAAGVDDKRATLSVAWGDYDGDGDLDLFVALRDRANAMYKNTNGHFVDVAPQIGLDDRRKTVGAVWFDYDEDGDLDLYVGNMDGDANALMRNDSGGHAVHRHRVRTGA